MSIEIYSMKGVIHQIAGRGGLKILYKGANWGKYEHRGKIMTLRFKVDYRIERI